MAALFFKPPPDLPLQGGGENKHRKPPSGCYVGKEQYGYCMVIVWCGQGIVGEPNNNLRNGLIVESNAETDKLHLGQVALHHGLQENMPW